MADRSRLLLATHPLTSGCCIPCLIQSTSLGQRLSCPATTTPGGCGKLWTFEELVPAPVDLKRRLCVGPPLRAPRCPHRVSPYLPPPPSLDRPRLCLVCTLLSSRIVSGSHCILCFRTLPACVLPVAVVDILACKIFQPSWDPCFSPCSTCVRYRLAVSSSLALPCYTATLLLLSPAPRDS